MWAPPALQEEGALRLLAALSAASENLLLGKLGLLGTGRPAGDRMVTCLRARREALSV